MTVALTVTFVMMTSVILADTHKKSGLDKWWHDLFAAKSQQVIKKSHKKKTEHKHGPNKASNKRIVDFQWLANYRELEIAWKYFIPDDDFIEASDGKFAVPIVVYRHYEDLAKTPLPSPTPIPE